MAQLILTQSQAEAVYSAMCALNNGGGRVKANFGDTDRGGAGINVWESQAGVVHVVTVDRYTATGAEEYPNQAAFATAYGLQQG